MRKALAEIALVASALCGGTGAAAQEVAAPPLPASAAAAASNVAADDARGLQDLARRVDALQLRVQRTQDEVEALQQRLRLAVAPRTDPLLYGLGALALLLLGVVAWLLRRLALRRAEASWLGEAPTSDLEPAPPPVTRPAPRGPPGFDEVTASSMRMMVEPRHYPEPQPPAPAPAPAPPPPAESASAIPLAAQRRRELTPDELIDLEQQADFFMALGQEESAIDLLMGHVRSSGGTSPLPYLKLLAIYAKRGESTAYTRIRERFNRRFNANAPNWDDRGVAGRPLEDYPDVLQRVQRAWAEPARATDLLEALLFRRDPAQAGFELPAYEELLFLYALAKELVAREANPDGVDLLLPLNEAPAPIAHVATPSPPPPRPAVDLDLDAPGSVR